MNEKRKEAGNGPLSKYVIRSYNYTLSTSVIDLYHRSLVIRTWFIRAKQKAPFQSFFVNFLRFLAACLTDREAIKSEDCG